MKKILIVGGGSAGWMSAAYLNGALNQRGEKPTVEITLLESPNIPRISVGEATIPSILHVLEVIGLDEIEFMKATDATFKQSIKYPNWHKNDGSFYHHPFSRYRTGPIDNSARNWLASQRDIPFMETVSAQPIICEMGLAPKMLTAWDMGAPLSYAYHMNAQKFADYLRDFSTQRGVKHILDDYVDAQLAEDGSIASISTKEGLTLEADIYVDCTGFRARLIGEVMGVGYEDCSRFLLADHATVMHIDYNKFFPGQVRPYTTATALSAGWAWDIPMRNRRSVGYVHASAFISEEQAEKELRAYEGPHAEDLPTKRIPFRVGKRHKAWEKNCIAIGLAGGFIEPLESTGLYLCDLAAVMLAEHFPHAGADMDALSFRFNRILANRFYEILDFINMHYCLSRRTDTPFWCEVQKPEHITDRLRAKFEFWRSKLPSAIDFEDQYFPALMTAQNITAPEGMGLDPRPHVDTAGLWNHESYECIMLGMNFCGQDLPPPAADAPKTHVNPVILQRLEQARAKLPPHHIWLNRVLGMEQYQFSDYQPKGWV